MTHEQKLLGQRDWRNRNKDRISVYNKNYQSQKDNQIRSLRRYRNNYGLSTKEYTDMLIAQSGRCAICEEPLVKRLALDHDHVTGKMREILCWYCNVMLGQAKDKSDILIRGAEYLKKHQPQ
jgi:Recombination endonuclease VII